MQYLAWLIVWVAIGVLYATADKYNRYLIISIGVMLAAYMMLTTLP